MLTSLCLCCGRPPYHYVYASAYIVVKINLYKTNQYLKTVLTSITAHKLPRLLEKYTVSLTLHAITENEKSFRPTCPTRLLHGFDFSMLILYIIILD